MKKKNPAIVIVPTIIKKFGYFLVFQLIGFADCMLTLQNWLCLIAWIIILINLRVFNKNTNYFINFVFFLGKRQKRRYFYTTFLRDPVERFISEYSHISRGANWLNARYICNGKPPTPDQLPMCYNPDYGWENVDLVEFLSCPFNLAFNRYNFKKN